MNNITCSDLGHRKKTLRSSIAKLWPNGEFSVYKPKKMRVKPPHVEHKPYWESLQDALIRAYGIQGALNALKALGLSYHQNSDKVSKKPARYGLKGISGKGKRRIRNACYQMTRAVGRRRLTFATVTLPDLSGREETILHQNWAKLIEYYVREVSRHLEKYGLSGEIVGCTEIQPKRFLRTGKPYLHAHFVFVGKAKSGGWVLSTHKHDLIWSRAIANVLDKKLIMYFSSCNLKEVKKNAAVYLAKYVSKGVKEIKLACDKGYEHWLPRQWWSCSRSLVQKQEEDMRIFSDGANLFLWLKQRSDKEFLAFFSDVYVETKDGSEVYVASYGALTKRGNGLVRKMLDLRPIQ